MGDNLPQKLAATSDFAKPPLDLSLLTPREFEVLRCFVDTPHEPPIVRRLDMQAKTVEVHLLNIQKKAPGYLSRGTDQGRRTGVCRRRSRCPEPKPKA
jgi:DNA-binding CsgD family transcriptional regulator